MKNVIIEKVNLFSPDSVFYCEGCHTMKRAGYKGIWRFTRYNNTISKTVILQLCLSCVSTIEDAEKLGENILSFKKL